MNGPALSIRRVRIAGMYGRLLVVVLAGLLGGCVGLPSEDPGPPPTEPRFVVNSSCVGSGPMSGNAAASVEDRKFVQDYLYKDAPQD